MENQYLSEIRFDSFPLDARILASLKATGFEYCSRIQAETLPLTLNGQDVTGQAQTGTGKTGAFLITTFQRLLQEPLADAAPGSVRCLILAPTRELAIQIARDAEELGSQTGLRSVLVYGGSGYDKQRRQFEQPVDVLIGTPGRVIDYWKQGIYHFKQTQVMVLDEADRMFDMGFIQDVRFLLRRLPPPEQRLNMLFSATLSQKVLELAYEHMNNPVPVKIETDSVSADNIVEHVYFPANNEKMRLLVGLVRQLNPFRAIVFVNTKHNAEKIDAFLNANGIKGAMISGDVRQSKRERLLQEFSEGKHQVLIATDVAARGLHISDVSHVFNYDLPQIAEDYVHRIGRTARAGASGEAHSFACEDTAFYLPEIEEYTGKPLPVVSISPELLPELERPARIERARPGGRDERKSRDGRSSRRSSSDRNGSGGGRSQAGGEGRKRHERKPAGEQASSPAAAPAPAGEQVMPDAPLNPNPVVGMEVPVLMQSSIPRQAPAASAVTEGDAPKKRRRRKRRSGSGPAAATAPGGD